MNQPVGYSNPPRSTRFKVGQSGNPHGRPRGSLNIATTLKRVLREQVTVHEGGRRKTVTKLEAAVRRLTSRAASGDIKAFQLVSALLRSDEERQNESGHTPPEQLTKEHMLTVLTNNEILLEAKRRQLKMPVSIEIVRERRPVRDPFGTMAGPAPTTPVAPADPKP